MLGIMGEQIKAQSTSTEEGEGWKQVVASNDHHLH
jgi:hypothetical protein